MTAGVSTGTDDTTQTGDRLPLETLCRLAKGSAQVPAYTSPMQIVDRQLEEGLSSADLTALSTEKEGVAEQLRTQPWPLECQQQGVTGMGWRGSGG